MKKFFVFVFVACSVAVAAQGVRPIGISVRAGQFRPQALAARNVSETWTVGGLDVTIRRLKAGKEETSLSVSVDYASRESFQTVPVCLNIVSRKKELYFFGGAGVSFTTVPRVVGPETERSDSIELAYQVGVGYDISNSAMPIFFELKYMGNGEDKLSAFALMIGVRL